MMNGYEVTVADTKIGAMIDLCRNYMANRLQVFTIVTCYEYGTWVILFTMNCWIHQGYSGFLVLIHMDKKHDCFSSNILPQLTPFLQHHK